MSKLYIDKIALKNIKIDKITNIKKLEEKGILSQVDYNSNNAYRLKSGQAIQGLNLIKWGMIDSLKILVKQYENARVQQCYLQISVKDEDYNNLFGFGSVQAIWDRLEQVRNQLVKYYGIYLNYSEIQIKTIELQKTFQTKDPFYQYRRVLSLILSQLPYPFRNGKKCYDFNSNDTEVNSYYAYSCKSANITENKYTCITFYDKTKQLRQTKEIPKEIPSNLIRFEIKIKKSSTIKKQFGSEFLKDITDDNLQDGYNTIIEKTIIKPLKEWEKDHVKALFEILKRNREQSNSWIADTLLEVASIEEKTQIPICLGLEDLTQAITLFDLTKQKKYKTKKKFETFLKSHFTTLQESGNDYLNEILGNLR